MHTNPPLAGMRSADLPCVVCGKPMRSGEPYWIADYPRPVHNGRCRDEWLRRKDGAMVKAKRTKPCGRCGTLVAIPDEVLQGQLVTCPNKSCATAYRILTGDRWGEWVQPIPLEPTLTDVPDDEHQ